MSATPPLIFTVGHSTRSFDELVAIVAAHGVNAIADVRAFPRSRRHPQFNDESLSVELPRVGIAYLPFKSLGGRRRSNGNSIHTAWRNESFRAYADYTQTPQFNDALEALMTEGRRHTLTIMCAEALPWRCHRSLIADVLLVRGWDVRDIFDERAARQHKLPDFAIVHGTAIEYRGEPTPKDPSAR
jgi:uncharacterized protein (DUF488 family)